MDSVKCSRNFPGKNTVMGRYFLLQGILLTQGSNLGLLNLRRIFLPSKPPFSVQVSLSVMSYSFRLHESQHARPPCPSQFPKFTQTHVIEFVMSSSHLILCLPLLLLPPIPPSIRVFSNESALQMRWSKYWSFSFNISPSNEHPGLISSRMDSLDFLSVQGTPKSLLQHHSSKVSILRC